MVLAVPSDDGDYSNTSLSHTNHNFLVSGPQENLRPETLVQDPRDQTSFYFTSTGSRL
jgi:hypothetical protein